MTTAGPRLSRPETTARGRSVQAALICIAIAGVAMLGVGLPPIALLAAGAGAGYSLSGSV